MFAKQVPKLVENIFGIKMEGTMALNPLKKFQDEALFGQNIIGFGAAGLAGGAAFAANFANGIYSSQNEKGIWGATKGLFKGLGSGIAGGISAAGRGSIGAIKGQKFGDIYKSSYGGAIKARNNRADRSDLKVNSLGIFNNQLTHSIGAPTQAEVWDAEIKVAQEFSNSSEKNSSIADSEVDKKAQEIRLSNFNGGSTVSVGGSTYDTLAELREGAHDQSKTAQERAAIDAKYNQMRGDIAAKLREQAYNGDLGLVGTEFEGITFDATQIGKIKS